MIGGIEPGYADDGLISPDCSILAVRFARGVAGASRRRQAGKPTSGGSFWLARLAYAISVRFCSRGGASRWGNRSVRPLPIGSFRTVAALSAPQGGLRSGSVCGRSGHPCPSFGPGLGRSGRPFARRFFIPAVRRPGRPSHWLRSSRLPNPMHFCSVFAARTYILAPAFRSVAPLRVALSLAVAGLLRGLPGLRVSGGRRWVRRRPPVGGPRSTGQFLFLLSWSFLLSTPSGGVGPVCQTRPPSLYRLPPVCRAAAGGVRWHRPSAWLCAVRPPLGSVGHPHPPVNRM